MKLYCDLIPSPLGEIEILTGEAGLLALDFGAGREARRSPSPTRIRAALAGARPPTPRPGVLGVADALRAYFAGCIDALDALPLELRGTPFQLRVWAALREIPPGETRSYGELARALGHPGAARAVGTANGSNPIAIVVPCHRVVCSDGALGGYAGGLERKRWLLEHESAAGVTRLGRPDTLRSVQARRRPSAPGPRAHELC